MSSNVQPPPPRNRYQVGATAMIACGRDPRFSYCLHVPASCDWSGARRLRLMVIVHGSRRMAQQECQAFADFADRHGLLLLAPLFPMGVAHAEDTEGYKLIRLDGIHYDELLLAMIDEVAACYPVDTERFFLHGFSGGGQFAHRFFYLYPERLWAVSIGAPGSVTLLDEERPWWVGTANVKAACGRDIDTRALQEVSVGLVIGEDDTDPGDVRLMDGSQRTMPGIDAAGDNRMQRLRALHASLSKSGITAAFDVVPGVAHNAFQVREPVKRHFARVLKKLSDSQPRPVAT